MGVSDSRMPLTCGSFACQNGVFQDQAGELSTDLKHHLPMNKTGSDGMQSTHLVYVERTGLGSQQSSAGSTTDGLSSAKSDISSKTRTKTIAMLQTSGLLVPTAKLDKSAVAAFKETLHTAGIDTSTWGVGGAKSVDHLFWETYQQCGCIIVKQKDNKLKRVTRLVKIRLVAEIFGVDHTLFSRMQFMHDGQTVERKQVPLRKLKWNVSDQFLQEEDPACYAEECSLTESWRDGATQILTERLGLKKDWQVSHLAEDVEAYRFSFEDNIASDGYPGLNTAYAIHEITFRVRDPEHAGVQVVGLPEGQEFATAEGDFNFHGCQDDAGMTIGSQLNIWTWIREVVPPPAQKKSATIHLVSKEPSTAPKTVSFPDEARLISRVPLPASSAQMLANMRTAMSSKNTQPPSGLLSACLQKMSTDWPRAKKIAAKIMDPKYTLHQFQADLSAFPELDLYLLEEKGSNGAAMSMNSGRTIGDEFQRTMGAFYAIYWMMRIDGDGKDGFAFGVDSDWVPMAIEDKETLRVTQPEKRMAFKEKAKWDFFQKLLVDAGLIELKKSRSGFFKTTEKYVVNEKRVTALLALTAIHDIMKMSLLLPEVQPQHAPYHGYAAGNTIGDHDSALSYIMEHYPSMLPSFKDLDEDDKRSVLFTQCNLRFNHGWFVQAEAPPGAIFTSFREAIIRDHKSKISQKDVALYFVHWITDLAGAEPTPLAGCEKFVTKFPLPVLNSFLRSFSHVERIATETETQVMEDYLKIRWQEHEPSLGPLPTGDSAIAKMRLACMAQMNANAVIKAFDSLSEEDKEMLNLEMSRTGCVGQSYSANLVPKEVVARCEGPAFLVYYGPAFFQSLGNDSPLKRLCVLADIYRCARELWPSSIAKVNTNVTIRIDVIKGLSTADMQETSVRGDVWMLLKHNETEAFVERSSKKKLNKLIASGQQFQVLDLSSLAAIS